MITTIIAAVIVLGVLIFVHELGHFTVAKLAGVGVETFSLGFGPRLFGFRRGGTDYRVSAIPLGGYVRMVGENPGEEVPPEDRQRSFAHKPVGWRLAIVAAGPVSNIVLAFLAFLLVLMIWGAPDSGPPDSWPPRVGGVLRGTPAFAAGLQRDDLVVAIDSQKIASWMDMKRAIKGSNGRQVVLTVRRGAKTLSLKVKPRPVSRTDPSGREVREFQIGIVAGPDTKFRPLGLFEAPVRAIGHTYYSSLMIVHVVGRLLKRQESVKNVGGPIFIAQEAGRAARQGLPFLLGLAGLISVNLAVLNLLPIPALDGGHLFFFLIEALIRRPVPLAVREKAQQIGMIILIMLMLLVVYNDIARILGIG